jgi:exopolyphosphatase / guanosine-5'-triphosphate,3'-diphosphate pyrophosphatase
MAQIEEFEPNKLQGWQIEISQLSSLLERLVTMDIETRRNLMIFDPQRADIIVSGGAIILAFMKYSGAKTITVSTKGLRFGLLAEIIEQRNA